MLSTPMCCCTSDYDSSSDLDIDYVKAAPHCCSLDETSIILHTLLNSDHHRASPISATIKVQQSMKLLKLVRELQLSDEMFIRATAILTSYLLSPTVTDDVGESILVACLSLAMKLSEHSSHENISFFSSDTLMIDENTICNALNWDIDLLTPVNYVEAILSRMRDSSIKQLIRDLTYQLIVLCLTDVRCVDLSPTAVALGCYLMASELFKSVEVVHKEIIEYQQDPALFEASLLYIRRVLINILRRSTVVIVQK